MVRIMDAAAGEGRDAKNDAKPSGADVALAPVCNGDAGPASKNKGDPCACNSECRTGHCADGVCCDSSCDGTCKACNLPGTLGECSLIPRGVPPANAAECPAEKPATCGRDGTCDGNGGCQLFVQNTVCDNGTCDGDGLSGVKICDGKGKCGGSTSRSCGPFSCNRDTNECQMTCTTNAECAEGQECSGRSCGLMLNGYKCADSDKCVSGFCSNGYCCNVACTGPCVSCAVPGSEGRCQVLAAGQPSSGCPAEPQSSCKTTGYCDGAGKCAQWPAEITPCASATCAGTTTLTATAVCDGKGSCQSADVTECFPYRCANGACISRCRSDNDCAPGRACVFQPGATTGTCGQKPNGQTCTEESECVSGHCVDGVCCESACEGPCRSCALPGAPGQCTNVPAGTHDPRKTCVDQGVALCGYDGMCDGAGACRTYPVGTKCGDSTCTDGTFTAAPTCDKDQICRYPAASECKPYVCNGNVCFNACTKNSDCLAPNACVKGSCGKKENGADCSAASECLSGFCAQGVCCNFACSESCKACNLTNTRGQCTAVADGELDPQELCKVTDKTTCGTTGACRAGACALWASATPCKPAACAGTTTLIPPSACDGHGVCLTPQNVQCLPYVCSANACPKTCQKDADCQAPNTCANGQCTLKGGGEPCESTAQCGAGLVCTEHVCCNSACRDAPGGSVCVSCAIPGSVGTCKPVSNGTTCDDGDKCTKNDACQSGTCKGAAVTCTAVDQCHFANTCDAASGLCTTPAKPDGDACDDGNKCTKNDTCQTGACKSGVPLTCTALDACHVAGTCDANTGVCTNPNAPEGTGCNDGNACTQTDKCVAGACTGSNPVTCTARDACHVAGTCNTTTGVCTNPNAPDGTGCNDGNLCTQTDKCEAGVCMGSNPVTCTPLDPCHVAGTCDTTTGHCSNPTQTEGYPCNDADLCTTGETCQAGLCTGGAPVTCPVSACQTVGACVPASGCPAPQPRPNDRTPCGDGSRACVDGQCSSLCTTDTDCALAFTCDTGTGACVAVQ